MNKGITEVKISMPLIDDIELQRIDNYYNDIVKEYTKAFLKEKEQVIAQRIMMNLQQENQQLKEQIEKCQLQNFNLKQDIMIKKISFPNKKIRDKSLIELYNMPSYEDLKRENQQLKEQLESSIGIVKYNMIIQKHVDRERKLQKKIEAIEKAKKEAVEFIINNISKERVESTPGNTYELKELHLSDYKLSELLKILEGVNDEK